MTFEPLKGHLVAPTLSGVQAPPPTVARQTITAVSRTRLAVYFGLVIVVLLAVVGYASASTNYTYLPTSNYYNATWSAATSGKAQRDYNDQFNVNMAPPNLPYGYYCVRYLGYSDACTTTYYYVGEGPAPSDYAYCHGYSGNFSSSNVQCNTTRP